MDGCIIWTGAATDRGYGQQRVNGKVKYVHRHAWEQEHGPIPKGLTIDHLCLVKLCRNTAHMEVVTRAENTRRARLRQRKVDCPHCGKPKVWYGGAMRCPPCWNKVRSERRRYRQLSVTAA